MRQPDLKEEPPNTNFQNVRAQSKRFELIGCYRHKSRREKTSREIYWLPIDGKTMYTHKHTHTSTQKHMHQIKYYLVKKCSQFPDLHPFKAFITIATSRIGLLYLISSHLFLLDCLKLLNEVFFQFGRTHYELIFLLLSF